MDFAISGRAKLLIHFFLNGFEYSIFVLDISRHSEVSSIVTEAGRPMLIPEHFSETLRKSQFEQVDMYELIR